MNTTIHKQCAARELFLQQSHGVLSTISIDVPGYPFGSVTPYCVDEECRPVIYISHIAQHTRNLVAESKASRTVLENGDSSDDVQSQGRITCIANARPSGSDDPNIRERYFRYVPRARQYERTHGFEFFRLDLVRVRFIGGFGHLYWVDPHELAIRHPVSAAQESRIIKHLN